MRHPLHHGNTKAINAEDTVREKPVIRDGECQAPNSTLPATEQWFVGLLPGFAGVAITQKDET